jgi:hypothetical protein
MDLLPEVEADDENYTVMFCEGRSFYIKTYQGGVTIQMYTEEATEVLTQIESDLWQDSDGYNHLFTFEVNVNDENR